MNPDLVETGLGQAVLGRAGQGGWGRAKRPVAAREGEGERGGAGARGRGGVQAWGVGREAGKGRGRGRSRALARAWSVSSSSLPTFSVASRRWASIDCKFEVLGPVGRHRGL